MWTGKCVLYVDRNREGGIQGTDKLHHHGGSIQEGFVYINIPQDMYNIKHHQHESAPPVRRVSLNDGLLKGPPTLADLYMVTLGMREQKMAFTKDIFQVPPVRTRPLSTYTGCSGGVGTQANTIRYKTYLYCRL
jgi:hypothetical protein